MLRGGKPRTTRTMDGTPRTASGLALEWLAAAALLAPGWLLPLARDQGHFAYCGQVVASGGVPYVDVFDQKGPATHYTFALLVALLGPSPIAVRGVFFVVALLSTRLAASLGERLAGPAARLPCAVLLALAVFQGDGGTAWNTGQIEDIQLLLELCAVWLLARARATWLHWWLAGLALGTSVAYKPTALLTALLVSLAAIGLGTSTSAGEAEPGRPSRGACVAAVVLGGLTIPGAMAAWLAYRGAWEACWEVLVGFNLAYAGRRESIASGVLMLLSRWGPLCAVAVCGLLLRPAVEGRLTGTLLIWHLVGSVAVVLWQGKYWPYHWTLVLGVLAIYAGVAAGRAISEFAGRLRELVGLRWLARPVAAALALLVALLAGPVDHRFLFEVYKGAVSVAAGRQPLAAYRAAFLAGAVSSPVHEQVAAYLRAHTQPDEPVLVWGYESVLYFLAQRPAPTRFVVDRVLCLAQPRQAAWRAEFLSALRRRPPSYVVVVEGNATPLWKDSSAELAAFPQFHSLLEREYRLEATIDHCRLYRWRLAGPWPSADATASRTASRLAHHPGARQSTEATAAQAGQQAHSPR